MQQPIEFVSTEDLMRELASRTSAGICAIAYSDEGGDKFIGSSWGSAFWRAGMADAMARKQRQVANDMLSSDEDE